MSFFTNETVSCANCGHKYSVVTWQSLNKRINPSEAEKLLSKELFNSTCPNCNCNNFLCYSMLYHDEAKQLMIYYACNKEDLDEANDVISKECKGLLSNSYTFRVVASLDSLIEKIIIFNHNLDDRIVEMLKLLYISQIKEKVTDLELENIFLSSSSEGLCFDITGNHYLTAPFNRSYYNDLKKCLLSLDSIDTPLIIDSSWALSHVHLIDIQSHLTQRKGSQHESTLQNIIHEPFETYNIETLSPNVTLMKGFLLLEESKWKKAKQFFNNFLDKNTTNSDAYIGLLLSEMHIKTKDDLATSTKSFTDKLSYKRAVRFANSEEKEILEKIALSQKQNVINNLLAKRPSSLNLKKALKILQSIPQNDISEKNIAYCKTFLKKNKKKSLIFLSLLSIIIFSAIITALLVFYYFIPNQKYNKAIKLREQGNYEQANIIFKEILDYKDSADLIHYHNYSLVVEKKPSTCTTSGSITYKCTGCNNTIYETIKPTGHYGSAATCTKPSTCTKCGTVYQAPLGHTTNRAVCSRCHTVLFKKLSFSGIGPSIIENIKLPIGTYVITSKHFGNSGNFVVKYHSTSTFYELVANEIGYSTSIDTINQTVGFEKHYIIVDHAKGKWTIDIELLDSGKAGTSERTFEEILAAANRNK